MSSISPVAFRRALGAGIRKFSIPLIIGLWAGLVSASAASAASPTGSFRGNAYGTFANAEAGQVAAALGRSAYIPCPCQGTNGQTLSNNVGNIGAGKNDHIMTADETESTAFTTSTDSTALIKFISKIQGLNALGGMITAASVTAVSHTHVDGSGITGDTSLSRFAGLQIDGQSVGATVAPNTQFHLPGLGNAILNKTTSTGNGTTAGLTTVDMIVINVTRDNSFGLAVGSQIVIGHATSGFSRKPIEVVLNGAAWGTEGNTRVSDQLRNQIGKAAFIGLPCNGTGSDVVRNNTSAITAAKVMSVGATKTTAFGGPTAAGTTARMTADVDNIQLLNGRISAGHVRAVATETMSKSGTRTRSAEGSGFSALQVMGTGVPDNVPPNTKMMLPGIGFVILNEQQIPPPSSKASTRVNGMHIFVTTANNLDLAVGSEIVIAHAAAAAKKFAGDAPGTPAVVASGD